MEYWSKQEDQQNFVDYNSEEFNKTNLGWTQKKFGEFFEKNLGFAIGEKGEVPKDAIGRRRMFVLKKDKFGKVTVLDYDGKQLSDGTPLEMNSFEFFAQMQMGNVLAYPLGGC